jgi:hypothetical protein
MLCDLLSRGREREPEWAHLPSSTQKPHTKENRELFRPMDAFRTDPYTSLSKDSHSKQPTTPIATGDLAQTESSAGLYFFFQLSRHLDHIALGNVYSRPTRLKDTHSVNTVCSSTKRPTWRFSTLPFVQNTILLPHIIGSSMGFYQRPIFTCLSHVMP